MKHSKQKIIFLDRDGVINRYPGDGRYVTSLAEFRFLAGVKNAIKKLTNAGYHIFVVSNQAGVAKKLYPKKILMEITSFMRREIEKTGGRIRRVLYCLHRQEDDCACRKPKAGLLKEATKNMRPDFEETYFIGDSMMDIKAGKKFGCKTVLVLSGREKLKNSPLWDATPDFIAPTLTDAAKNILNHRYARA